MTYNNQNLDIGGEKVNKTSLDGTRQVHPYMKNNFKGTPEIQEIFRQIYNPVNTTFTIDNT